MAQSVDRQATRTGPDVVLPSRFAVTEMATDAVHGCANAALALAEARGLSFPDVGVDTRAVAVAISSERHLRIDGQPPPVWAPLSGFFATTDGWVRLHGNYPHHAAALRRALGLASDAGRDDVASALRERAAPEVEDLVVAAGGVAAAVRTEGEWLTSPPGRAVGGDDSPIVESAASGHHPRALTPARRLPAEGLRVLDLTRVIAGPVAGRALALWGADVLRVDPPQLPELPWQHLDMNPGKRVALLDARSADGAARLRELALSADVVLCGYRPEALHRHGLGAEDLLTEAGHLVVVELSAWGHRGPWRTRRGFDSIVQAASGIATDCAVDGIPGALPAQVLDHASGYLAAQTAMLALSRRPAGGGCHLRLSLARTARWLRSFGPRDPEAADAGFDPTPYVVETDWPAARVRTAGSPFTLGGTRLDYPFPARPYGVDEARWS